MKVLFESNLVIEFELPDARYTSSGGSGGQTQARVHTWRLEVTADNAALTAQTFRALADEIDQVRLKSIDPQTSKLNG